MRQSTLKRDRKAVHSAALDAAREAVPEATLEVVNAYRRTAVGAICMACVFGFLAAACLVGWIGAAI